MGHGLDVVAPVMRRAAFWTNYFYMKASESAVNYSSPDGKK